MYGGDSSMARNKHPEETINLIIEQSLNLFLEKGYDSTSIQDVISRLGGLSKGAIYHHFKSKEEIFEAVTNKIGRDNSIYYDKIRDDPTKNGYEKLKAVVQSAYANPTNDAIIAMKNRISSDPKFLSKQIFEIYTLIAPQFVQPIIEQGIKDGSIQTAYPKELAEVIITLLNIWVNPIIAKSTEVQICRKLEFLALLLRGIGIDIFDAETIRQYAALCQRYH